MTDCQGPFKSCESIATVSGFGEINSLSVTAADASVSSRKRKMRLEQFTVGLGWIKGDVITTVK